MENTYTPAREQKQTCGKKCCGSNLQCKLTHIFNNKKAKEHCSRKNKNN